jgi:hypothetical protein
VVVVVEVVVGVGGRVVVVVGLVVVVVGGWVVVVVVPYPHFPTVQEQLPPEQEPQVHSLLHVLLPPVQYCVPPPGQDVEEQ